MDMRPLRDDEIEEELANLFGLENPDESEDEFEGDEICSFDLQQLLEESATSIIPNSPPSVTQASDVVEPLPSCSRETASVPPSLSRPTIAESDSSEDEIIPVTQGRRRRSPIIETSESESDSDEDEEEWKKSMWANERPNPERFSDVLLQPAVFFPSRTSPLAYFTRFFSDEVLEMIVEQTNIYAAQQNSKNWEPVTVTDIKMLLGVIIMMGLHTVPSWDLYWSSDLFSRVDEIARVMTCKRYKKIMENLHLADNSKMPTRNDPQYDKLYQVRPLLNLLNDACQREAKTTTCQSIDEAMIKFKGVSSLKQYMPLKPIKRGFKVWVRADSASGYVFQFEIYTGKNANNIPELGLGANVVKSLTTALIEKKVLAHVTFDNFFSSYALMQYLYEHGIYSTATVNSNRAELPKLVKNKEKAKANQKQLQRGQYKWRVKNEVAFLVWKDTKPVTILTTAFHPTSVTTCNRTMKDGTNKEIECPEAVLQYTQRMGGVDRFDQKRGTYEVGRKSKKWWRRIFYFTVDLALTNAYLLYQHSLRVPNPMSNMSFRLAVARGLIANCSSRKRKIDSLPKFAAQTKKAHSPSQNYQKVVGVPDEVRHSNVGIHMPHEMSSYRRCRLCSTAVKNTRSKIMCSFCQVPLCVYPCFATFHNK